MCIRRDPAVVFHGRHLRRPAQGADDAFHAARSAMSQTSTLAARSSADSAPRAGADRPHSKRPPCGAEFWCVKDSSWPISDLPRTTKCRPLFPHGVCAAESRTISPAKPPLSTWSRHSNGNAPYASFLPTHRAQAQAQVDRGYPRSRYTKPIAPISINYFIYRSRWSNLAIRL